MPPELLTWSSDVERLFIRIERYFRAADRRAAMVQYHMDEAMGDVLLAMEAEETDDYDKHTCLDTLVFGEQEAGGGYLPTLSVILEQFSDVLAASDEDLGRTSVIHHAIHTGDAKPVRCSPRRIAYHQPAQVETLLNEIIHHDVIEPSCNPWAFPIVLVKKKDGWCRFCVDYRQLNNVEMETRDREKTASITPYGLYQFKVMPFGLCNAPATFQRLMETSLRGLAVPGVNFILPEVRKRLLEGDTRWKWTEDCQAAFDAVKHQLTSAPILAYPDFRRRFLVDVDASGDGLGAVLSQRDGKLDFEVEHRPGRLHGNADVLSRTSCAQCGRPMKSRINCWPLSKQTQRYSGCVSGSLPTLYPHEYSRDLHMMWQQGPNWIVEEGLICRRRDGLMAEERAKHVLVPRALRSEIMIPAQQSVRGPPRRTCRTCTQCAARKSPSKNSRPLMQPMTASYPLQRVGMDILGPFERIPFVNRYVLVLTDYFTRWTAAFPLANMEAETVAKRGLSRSCAIFSTSERPSPPHIIRNGTDKTKDSIAHSWACCPSCARKIGTSGTKCCFASCWRTTVNVNESTGVAPAMAMFGRELQLPLGIQMASPQRKDTETLSNYIRQTSERIDIEHEQMRRQLKVQQRWQKSLYDRKATQEPLRLAPADITFLFSAISQQTRN
ncbi:Transposon Ty3-I Gag-Pol polyprotein [Trichinella papuae]|uniref:Transposon Ty3-I Gag-Pol polyprotein n=1 Tax=Trichinella papuae TaxID=268474 RepID=A0A0V1MBH5_9BILA|nr:Transposon Ty3-I Gag-Pol polyprotein [Trichinella papuae]